MNRPHVAESLFKNQQSIGVGAGAWVLVAGERFRSGVGWLGVFQSLSAHTTLVRLARRESWPTVMLPVFSSRGTGGEESSELNFVSKIELKSLILAQIERWRHALHMQVERGAGATLHSVANG